MKLGSFKTIAEPDPPACWLYKNVRIKGYVGEVDRPTDQYIRRPLEHIFKDACDEVKELRGPTGEDARIVEVRPLDEYGSLLFKWEYWGIPPR